MEDNKENSRQKVKTKIPLPMKPLPALPRHLLDDKNVNQNGSQRLPLKTLAHTNLGFPTSSKSERVISDKEKAISVKIEKELDTKHVTMRIQSENLDWDYKVFKDQSEGIITISDDENDANAKEIEYFEGNMQRNCLGDRSKTPSDKLKVQHKSIKNIKMSLRRPHSRELQGISPPRKLEKRDEDRAKRRLQFNESVQERLQSPDICVRAYNDCMNRDYTDYIVNYLLSVENKPAQPLIRGNIRACVINWMMNVNGPSGNPATVQTACWYLDSVLSLTQIKIERLQLAAAACYWIAQKVHGPVVQALKLVKSANYAFTAERLLTSERAVLLTLDFPRQPVVPHAFITYLAWWCDSNHPGEIEVAATFLCMSGLMVAKELCGVYPSVIACAAIRNAVRLLQKKEAIKLLENCPLYKAVERKSSNLLGTCSILRRAVRVVADDDYEYKAPLQHYGVQPYCIAQKIIAAVHSRSSSSV